MPRARLHRSSVVVGVISACLLVLLCVPGRIYELYPGSSIKFEHGWPLVYLHREREVTPPTATTFKSYRNSLDSLPMGGIPWLSADNWRFWEAADFTDTPRREFSPVNLAFDALLLLLLLTSIVILFEYRRRRRASVLSFSLTDIFVSLTLACCALGWIALVRNSFPREVAAQAALEDEDSPGSCEEVCIAPAWARSLVGDRWMPFFMWRAGKIDAGADIVKLPVLCDDMRALPYSTKLALYGPIFGDGHYPYARLKVIRQLQTLSLGTYPRLDDRDVQELSQLSSLKRLILPEGTATPEIIDRLQTALPRCTIVQADADL